MIEEKLVTLWLPYYTGQDRKVRVFVPQHEEDEMLPVIYMMDGQSLFDDESSAFGSWHAHEAVKAFKAAGGKGAIIVGIHNDTGARQRTNELTPKTMGKLKVPLPLRLILKQQGELFDRFLMDTVKPTIEKDFPVMKGRENTAVGGSSSGGLEAFFIAMEHPEEFGYAAVFSPAFVFVSGDDIKTYINKKITGEMPFLYIYSGAGEKLEKQICQSVEEIVPALDESYPKDLFKVDIRKEFKHHESAWEPVFKDFLEIFLN